MEKYGNMVASVTCIAFTIEGRLSAFVVEFFMDWIWTTVAYEFYIEERVPTLTRFGIKINELPFVLHFLIVRFGWIGNLFSWLLPGYHRKLFTACGEYHRGIGGKNGFSPSMQSCMIHCTWSNVQRPPTIRNGDTLLPVDESTKFLGQWWDSHVSFKNHISALKTQCK